MNRILLLILSTVLMCACGKNGYSESDVMTVYKYNRTSTGCCGPTRDYKNPYILIEECNKLAYTDTIFIDEKSFDKIRNALTTKKKVKYDNPYQLRLYVKADSTEFSMNIGDNVGVVPGDSVFYHVDD